MDKKVHLKELDDYLKGYIRCLYDHSWWQDTTRYIGSGVWTLEEAIDIITQKVADRKKEIENE